MKRLEVILVLFFLVLFLGHTASFACGGSSANAGASANANAGAIATGGSAGAVASGGSAQVDNNNTNIAAPKIGVEVEVNPGQTVAPETSSKVTIDSHAVTNYKYVNRHFFLYLSAGILWEA